MNRRMLLALIAVITAALLLTPKSIGIGLGFVVFLAVVLLLKSTLDRGRRL